MDRGCSCRRGIALPEAGDCTLAFHPEDVTLERASPGCVRFVVRAGAADARGEHRFLNVNFAGAPWLCPLATRGAARRRAAECLCGPVAPDGVRRRGPGARLIAVRDRLADVALGVARGIFNSRRTCSSIRLYDTLGRAGR